MNESKPKAPSLARQVTSRLGIGLLVLIGLQLAILLIVTPIANYYGIAPLDRFVLCFILGFYSGHIMARYLRRP